MARAALAVVLAHVAAASASGCGGVQTGPATETYTSDKSKPEYWGSLCTKTEPSDQSPCFITPLPFSTVVLKAGTWDHAWSDVEAGEQVCVPSVGGGAPKAISHIIFCYCPPTSAPTSSAPSASPTSSPTHSPSKAPSASPTKSPTQAPTTSPTQEPSASPTQTPSSSPTRTPTASPTQAPTASPTQSPSKAPSTSPTTSPTQAPTTSPTQAPTASPSQTPTASPTQTPSSSPTRTPTESPTQAPTASPTSASPTSASPTTASPTSASPTSASPTTSAPTTASPSSASPTSAAPTSTSPTSATGACGGSLSGPVDTPNSLAANRATYWGDSCTKDDNSRTTPCFTAQQSFGVLVLKAGTYDHTWHNVAAGETVCVPSVGGGAPKAISHIILCSCAPQLAAALSDGEAAARKSPAAHNVAIPAAAAAAAAVCAALAVVVTLRRRKAASNAPAPAEEPLTATKVATTDV